MTLPSQRGPAPPTVLLGPQRFSPTLASVVRSLGIGGEIAAVTAGWQEREEEDAELRDHLQGHGCATVNLMLHARGEQAFAEDPALRAAHGLRQERLRQLQEVYHLRLLHLVDAAKEAFESRGDGWLLDPERDDAIEAIRRLDEHHMARVQGVHAVFDGTWRPAERPAFVRHRSEIASILGRVSALAIAGGHVAVLLNRLRMFGVLESASRLPVIAWSAGAMVLAERIVLFHDAPAQGPGAAEVLGPGYSRVPGIVPLPHARRRLALDDPMRVAVFARRFAPSVLVALDPGARVDWDGRALRAAPGTHRLSQIGRAHV